MIKVKSRKAKKAKRPRVYPHFFVIEVHPTFLADPDGKIGGGFAHIWVFAKNFFDARKFAKNEIEKLDWVVDDVSIQVRPNFGQISQLEESERSNFETAEVNGNSVEFIG